MRLLSWAQLKKKSLIRLTEIAQPLGLTERQALQLVSRLSRAGLILRIGRGVYLVPDRLPPGGKWGPDRLWVLDQYMRVNGASYQITGMEVFNRYGLSTQIPNVLTVYNTRVSGRCTLGNAQFEMIKVPAGRIGGTRAVPMSEGGEVPFPTLSRALLDAVYDWSRFNLFSEALDRIVQESRRDPKFLRELIDAVIRYGNIGTLRRIGCVLETRANISKKRLAPLLDALPKSKSVIALNPAKPAKGKVNSRWGVIVNG